MTMPPSTTPDKVLRGAVRLSWPFNRLAYAGLRRLYQAWGRASGELTSIPIGTARIVVPLAHPAVYWRFSAEFNQNFLALVRETVKVRKGWVVDVGANVGDGVAMIRGAGIDAPVLAIEGAQVWFDFLKSNTQAFSGVVLEQVFLGADEQEGGLALVVRDGTSKLVRGQSDIVTLPLDAVLARHDEHPVALLKTDTDGFDAKAIFGAKSTLIQQKPVLFMEVAEGLLRAQGDGAAQLIRFLADCGYASVAVWDNFGRWLCTRSIDQGISDLIVRYPGDPGLPYLDVAAFSHADAGIMDRLVTAYAQR